MDIKEYQIIQRNSFTRMAPDQYLAFMILRCSLVSLGRAIDEVVQP